MSLIRTGHRPQDWQDQGPTSPLASRYIRGALVIGASGPAPVSPERRAQLAEAQRRARAKANPPVCGLTGRCRHASCVDGRRIEARRLYSETSLSLTQIGQMLGGRDHSTIAFLLRTEDAA